MFGGSTDVYVTIATAFTLVVVIGFAYHQFPLTPGRDAQPLLHHLTLLGAALATVFLLPISIAQYVFSDLAVTAVGTVFPIYESVRAVCTPDEDDDKYWLQYWLVGGVIFLSTGWVDNFLMMGDGEGDADDELSNIVVMWRESMCFFFLWLYFPLTDGAALVYNHFTGPILTPLVKPLAHRMTSWISYLYQTMVNAVHLWLVWFIFVFLPPGLKRIVAVAIGTVYPWVSSVAAAATEEVEDDTQWLTYWSCYGTLFLVMDLLEVWLGWVPGFYTVVIFTTVYLMLPMFQGADKVFRRILVPLAGLQELLMLRDAIQVKKDMLKLLPPERATVVRKAIARFFDDEAGSNSTEELQRELKTGWHDLSLRRIVGGKQETQTYNDGLQKDCDLSEPMV